MTIETSKNLKQAIATFLKLLDPGERPGDAAKETPVSLVAIVLIISVLTAVFINRAIHIDDPVYIWAAQRIQTHPADPYGFSINWYGESLPVSEVTKNPPLASYYIAAAAFVLGWSEPALHFIFLLPALAVALGTYVTARRFCRHPLLAALISILTPVFFVSSVTVMCDMMMLAFWVWALHLWVTGLERTDHLRLAASGLMVALSALSKYYGLTLIPLLIAYSIFKQRRLGWWVVHVSIPIAILAWYQFATQKLYGHGHLLHAAAYATDTQTKFGKFSLAKLWIGAAFTGGCVAAGLFFCLQLWSRTAVFVGALFAGAVSVVFLAMPKIGIFLMPAGDGAHLLLAVQLGIWGTAGVGLLALSLLDLHRHRDADAALLSLWMLGTFTFAAFVNWTTNGRSILPMIVPAGILITRRLELVAKPRRLPWPSTIVPLAAGLILSFFVTFADTCFADTGRVAADRIRERYVGSSKPAVWFQGHWGFQYYLELAGAKPIEVKRPEIRLGDIIVRPTTNSNLFPMPDWAKVREVFEIPLVGWISTMNPKVGAGFYADVFGPLPFAIGRVANERITVFSVAPLEPPETGSSPPPEAPPPPPPAETPPSRP